MRILLTGAAGSIGRVLLTGLTGHDIVGLDLRDPPDTWTGEWQVADCTDPVAANRVVALVRPDAIVHLAGNPAESSLPVALRSHVLTTAALLEAMVAHDVRRIVYASSNHAVGRTPRADVDRPNHRLTVGTPPRPDTFYGVAKVATEALMRLYVDRHGIDAVSCRIGSFLAHPETRRQLSSWLSPADAVRMVDAALTTPAPGFAVLYGISDNTRAWWDLEAGRALGYRPEDDAENFADQVLATPESLVDRAEATHVGGPYATAQLERPAFDLDEEDS